jgi:hypothetical protein
LAAIEPVVATEVTDVQRTAMAVISTGFDSSSSKQI